ncbi:hypothetical protein GCM10010985_02020 [Caballeronia grimmiae]|uniref:Uncharacterized protein n=1 Tax=Caballeronia grimmiae TaxID=1071679 RepID=A0ABQ1QYG9_9BURK|nr:hypothetical protein GCM10010985_02020 [Caballeronia grimmiae]
MRELVSTLLVRLDVLLVDLGFGEVVYQQFELAAGVDHAFRMGVENLEEFALGGHETTEHENPDRWVNEAVIKPSYCTRAVHVAHRAMETRERGVVTV